MNDSPDAASPDAIMGTVIPVQSAALSLGAYEGRAAFRDLADGREVAFIGAKLDPVPANGTLDGKPFDVVREVRTPNKATVVVLVRMVEEAAAVD